MKLETKPLVITQDLFYEKICASWQKNKQRTVGLVVDSIVTLGRQLVNFQKREQQ